MESAENGKMYSDQTLRLSCNDFVGKTLAIDEEAPRSDKTHQERGPMLTARHSLRHLGPTLM